MELNCYGVKIIKHILVTGDPDPTLIDENYGDEFQSFEESIVLVKAESFEQAYEIAIKKSREFEEPYTNLYGQKVLWKFVDAVDCYLADDITEQGAEVYSCFHTVPKKMNSDVFIKKYFTPDEDGHFAKE